MDLNSRKADFHGGGGGDFSNHKSSLTMEPITKRGDRILSLGCVKAEARQPSVGDALIWFSL